MRYFIITNGTQYYSHTRAFSHIFEPYFTRDISNAKYFSNKQEAQNILSLIKKSGLLGYKVVEF